MLMGGYSGVERYTLVCVSMLAAHMHLGCALEQMDICFPPHSVKISFSRDI